MRFVLESLLVLALVAFSSAQPRAPTNVELPWRYTTANSVRAQWNAVPGCIMFKVELLQAYSEVVLETFEGVSERSLEIDNLEERTVYGVRVQCTNRRGRVSQFSLPGRTKTMGTTTMAPTTTPKPSPPVGPCGEGFFTCNDGNCTTADDWCSGIKECDDGSDEMDCPGQCEAITEFHSHGNYSCSLFNAPTSACFFDCDTAFNRVGPYYTVCQDQQWTLEIPTCRLMPPIVFVVNNGSDRNTIFVDMRFQDGAVEYIAPTFRTLDGEDVDVGTLNFAVTSGIVEGRFSGLARRTTYAFTLAGVTSEGELGLETEEILYARTA